MTFVLEFHTRYPNGKKTVIYKKAKLEKFADYLNRDGLVTRLSIYTDNECKCHFRFHFQLHFSIAFILYFQLPL